MISDPTAVLLVLAIVVHVAIRLQGRYRLFRSLGSVVVSILTAMALSNIGLLPGRSETYVFLRSTGVSFAIVLILLSVDVRSIIRAGPRMLVAFGIGAAGTAIGATGAGLALNQVLGPETWKLAGQYTGTYTGGGVNFAALARAFDTSADLFSAAIACDVVTTNVWLVACMTIPMLLGPGAKSTTADVDAEKKAAVESPASETGSASKESGSLTHTLTSSVRPILLADAAALGMIAIGLVWFAGRLAPLIPVPEVLILTTLVLLVAQVPAVKTLTGSAVGGNYLLHLFLAGNGAQAVIANIIDLGPAVLYFAATTVAVHGAFIFGIGRLVGIDAVTLAVASQANIGGPASVIALCGTRGYPSSLLPGIAVGLFGYAAGNYLGLAVAMLVRHMVGG